MASSPPDAAAEASGLLAVELSEAIGVDLPDARPAPSTAARDWAGSGAMHLTGRTEGPPRLAPGGPASWMRAAAQFLGTDLGRLDAAALLGERAACTGAGRQGPRSVGGAFRSIRARDGWFGLSLARESDVELVPALIEGSAETNPWHATARWLADRPVGEAEARAQLLGLPAAAISTCPATVSRPAVLAEPGGRRPSRARPRPLVVDLSALWAGPLCSCLLGLAGARVVKVESHARPDGARIGAHTFFDLLHAGHESVAVDLDSSEGRRLLAELVRWADVVVEGSRPRALAQLGIDAAEHVAAGTIWVAVSAYGRAEAHRVGFGDDVAAAAGLVVDDGDGPYPVGDAIADPLTGATAAAATSVALRSRRGWLLDVSMRDVAAHAGKLAADDATVIRRHGQWWVECADDLVPVRRPCARVPSQRAPELGADTDSVLAELRASQARPLG